MFSTRRSLTTGPPASYRPAPYLGWRSQDRLAGSSTGLYSTPAQRLAASSLQPAKPRSAPATRDQTRETR